MATTAANKPAPEKGSASRSSTSKSTMMTWLPYAIGIGAQLPLLFFYFIQLWDRGPHYHFFPLAILAVIAIAWIRWPREERMKFHRSLWSDTLLVIGIVCGLGATLFLEPWFAAASAMFLTASFLARTVDPETGKGMWVVSLPIFVTLVLPMNGDMYLITWLQRISAVFTSRMLDLVGIGHHMPGTTIQIPGKEAYGIEQACSGVMSFFTLLFVAVVFIVWNRRPWFRATLLIVSAVFWAVFMNTIRIFMIPFADKMMGMDLATGFAHDMLGWIVLLVGILMLLSTDQFLMFLFGPVEASTGRAGPFGAFLTEFWNGLVSGQAETEEEKAKRKRRGKVRKPISPFTKSLLWTMAGLLGFCGLWQAVDAARSYGQRKIDLTYFVSDAEIPLAQGDLGDIGKWKVDDYSYNDRKVGSDLGLRSDAWRYKSPTCPGATASFDQTFPGWHELTTCYRNQGWQIVENGRVRRTDDESKWPFIEARFEKATGEKGFLLFSFFDAFGEPYDAPDEWGTLNSFLIRASGRLSHRVRARLFQGEAYQCQVFISTFGEMSDAQKDETTEHFKLIREQMRKSFLEKRSGGDAPANEPAETETARLQTPVTTDPAGA